MKTTLILISVYAIILFNLTTTTNSFAFGHSTTNNNNNGRLFALSDEGGDEYLKEIKRSPRLFATNLNDFPFFDLKQRSKFAKHRGGQNDQIKQFAFAKRSNLESDAFAMDSDDMFNIDGSNRFAILPFAKRKPFAKREVKSFAFA
uniref:Uncharacterized protein n=1 Tax=Parastrongyloides trichosuri TaxID=131310 RepID=A0A0N5A727_PARTI